MFRIATTILIACVCSQAFAQYPDGTMVYSSKPGSIVGRVAQRWASRAQGYQATHTHVGIVLNGKVYHADYPRVTTKPIGQLKRGEVAHYVLPSKQYTQAELSAMRSYAESQVGKPYRLAGFIRRDGQKGWCSTFVGEVAKRGGHSISYGEMFTPDNLRRAIAR